jgi:hypothetical protein
MASPRYYIDISHSGLGTHKRVSGTDRYFVEQQAQAKLAEWEESWRKKQAAAGARQVRERERQQRQGRREAELAYRDHRKKESAQLTSEVEQRIEHLGNLLARALVVSAQVDFDSMRDESRFPEHRPREPHTSPLPDAPRYEPRTFVPPAPSIWQRVVELFNSRSKEERLRCNVEKTQHMRIEDETAYVGRQNAWRDQCAEIARANTQVVAAQRDSIFALT